MLLRIKKKAAKKAPYEVRIALTKQEVRAAVAECLAHDVVGLDTETTGCNPLKESPCIIAKAFSVQIAYKNIAYFIPTFHIDGVCDFRDLVDELAPLWKKASEKIVAHNYKYDAHVMENAGLRPHSKSLLGDTQVMSFTHNSGERFHGLKECVKRWFKEDTVEFKPTFRVPKLKKDGQPGKAFRDVDFYEAISNPPKYVKELYLERVLPFREKLSGGQEAAKKLWLACGKKISRTAAELIISYASLDPIYTVKLYELLKEKLLAIKWANGKSLFHYFELIEVPYTMTLYRVERRGIRISKEKLLAAEKKCEADIVRTMSEFNRLCVKAGASTERMAKFNPKSGKDIAWIFKEVLGVKAKTKRRKNGSESESWDDSTMEALLLNKKARPIVLMLQEYRVAVKILGTYIKPFLHQYATYKGFLHTTLKQASTRTARLSSSAPNLQTAPKNSNDPYGLRECFVASEDENSYLVMGDIDLAQVEARFCAHVTQDPSLLKAIRAGWDLHALTATKAFSNVREFIGAQEITAELLAEVKKKFPLERDRSKCFHPDTEVLTRAGWKKILEVAPGEQVIQAIPSDGGKVKLEWIVPWEIYAKKHPSKRLIHLVNKGVDIRVTPDHRMLAFTKDGVRPKVVSPMEFGKQRLWAQAGIEEGPGDEVDERILRLAVATQADGSYERRSGRIKFGFTRERKIERMKALLKRGEYLLAKHKNGKNPDVTAFTLNQELSTRIKALLDEKMLSWGMVSYTQKLRLAILEEASHWDSHIFPNGRYSFSSAIQQNVDVLQAVASISGYKSRISQNEDGYYALSVRNKQHLTRGGNVKASRILYTKKVACISVPSSYLLVRDGGTPLICGQTIFFGSLYGQGAQAFAALFGVSAREAQEFLDNFFNGYSGIKAAMKKIQLGARERGYVRTYLQRYARVPESQSHIRGVQLSGDRKAFNYVLQGGAGDMVKCTMILCEQDKRLKRMRVRMRLPIHDELIFTLPKYYRKAAKPIIEEYMSRPFENWGFKPLTVDTPADIAYGKNWAEAKG